MMDAGGAGQGGLLAEQRKASLEAFREQVKQRVRLQVRHGARAGRHSRLAGDEEEPEIHGIRC